MSFTEKVAHIIQVSFLTVLSVVTFVTLAGVTVYAGSRAVDWAFGLNKHTSLKWVENHSTSILNGINSTVYVAMGTRLR